MSPRSLLLFGWTALATTAAALLVGCVPVVHLDASPVAGRVVDRATGRPIAGAQVVLNAQPDHEARTQTDLEGRFRLAGFRHLELVPLPYGMFRAPTGFLQVSATHYRPYAENEFLPNEDGSPGYLGPGTVREVRVALTRAGNQQVPAHGN